MEDSKTIQRDPVSKNQKKMFVTKSCEEKEDVCLDNRKIGAHTGLHTADSTCDHGQTLYFHVFEGVCNKVVEGEVVTKRKTLCLYRKTIKLTEKNY